MEFGGAFDVVGEFYGAHGCGEGGRCGWVVDRCVLLGWKEGRLSAVGGGACGGEGRFVGAAVVSKVQVKCNQGLKVFG